MKDLLGQPSSAQALHWLMDNGLVVKHVVPASLPAAMIGHHGYGHPGFDDYRLTAEARDVIRCVFGSDVWTVEP